MTREHCGDRYMHLPHWKDNNRCPGSGYEGYEEAFL